MSNRINPEYIETQRSLGWPDIHPEDYCHLCGIRFESWYCDRETWLEATSNWAKETGREGICCLNCFTEMYKQNTGLNIIWKIMIEK